MAQLPAVCFWPLLRKTARSPFVFFYPSLCLVKGMGSRAKRVGEKDTWWTALQRSLPFSLSLSCRRCIIVGNGGVLANKSLGSRIDDYDIVVR